MRRVNSTGTEFVEHEGEGLCTEPSEGGLPHRQDALNHAGSTVAHALKESCTLRHRILKSMPEGKYSSATSGRRGRPVHIHRSNYGPSRCLASWTNRCWIESALCSHGLRLYLSGVARQWHRWHCVEWCHQDEAARFAITPQFMPEGKRVSFPTPSQACGMSTGRSLGRSGIWLHGQTVVEVSLPYIHMILSLAFHELHTDRVDAGGFDGGC
jgi:hypothetical protein